MNIAETYLTRYHFLLKIWYTDGFCNYVYLKATGWSSDDATDDIELILKQWKNIAAYEVVEISEVKVSCLFKFNICVRILNMDGKLVDTKFKVNAMDQPAAKAIAQEVIKGWQVKKAEIIKVMKI